MKVLLVSNMYAYPGNWDKLDALGGQVELQVVTPARWATERELHPISDVPLYQGGRWVHHPLPTFTQGNPFRYVYRPRPLLRVLRAFRPQLVHVEQEPESLSLLQLSLLKPVFGYRLLFVAWENVNPLRLGWVFRRVDFVLADGAIFGNQAALERSRAQGYRGPSALIPQYGFAAAERTSRGSTDGRFAVGFAGRLVPEKGVLTLLQALERLGGLELVVAGDGPLAGLVRAAPAVRWMGALDRPAMGEFWRAIDVLVVPSLTTRKWAEQFGRVVVEAMAHGVPVIGSSSGAIPEVIGDAGLVFPEGDPAGLATEIARLRADDGLRESLVARGYERVDSVYHHDVVTARTVDFYRALLTARVP